MNSQVTINDWDQPIDYESAFNPELVLDPEDEEEEDDDWCK
jgi:hypothetical protein